MKIAICVKQVPDSWAEKKMVNGLLDRESVDAVLNDLDEYAIEEALRIVEPLNEGKESPEHTITLISMGPDRATEAIRKGLSMGADDAVLVSDAALAGSDAIATSKVLAEVIKNGGFDLVFCGTESTDARMSVVPAMLAERLGWAQLTFAGSVKVDAAAKSVEIARMTESGVENMSANFPCVISVIEKINEPRYPSFKGIMAAKKKTIENKSLADISISANEVGIAGAWSVVESAQARPPREKGVKIEDSGDAGTKLADYLAEKRLV
ncbi:MAG: electron transfer flavoprotein subunit beta/FixA family protein [Candidatus Nanopelagicaceae bacterium]|nr:electron transfer flavoprotein subunit beta/FixA family protein [Candidatus Nanopelagicaceae bacterium]